MLLFAVITRGLYYRFRKTAIEIRKLAVFVDPGEGADTLDLSKASNLFKLFQNDVGLLAAEYGGDIQLKILQHEITVNFGAVCENTATQELTAHGFPLFYYNSKRFGEVDFLVENDGAVIPIEIKSGKDYYRHNAIDHLLENPEFDIPQGCVF